MLSILIKRILYTDLLECGVLLEEAGCWGYASEVVSLSLAPTKPVFCLPWGEPSCSSTMCLTMHSPQATAKGRYMKASEIKRQKKSSLHFLFVAFCFVFIYFYFWAFCHNDKKQLWHGGRGTLALRWLWSPESWRCLRSSVVSPPGMVETPLFPKRELLAWAFCLLPSNGYSQ